MRKLLLCVFVLAFGVLSTGAQDAEIPETLPEGVTIQYWHQYNNEFQQATVNAIIEAFNRTNEWGITVEATPSGNYNDIRNLMNSAIQSGDLPNIIPGFPNDALSYALEEALLIDLNAYVTHPTWGLSEDAMAELNQSALNAWVFDSEPHNGARLGWVNQISGAVLFYNQDMIEALGFEGAPATLDDLEAIACAAAEATELTGAEGADVQGYPIVADASQFESFVAGIGGSIWNEETGMWDFTSAEVITVLELYNRMYAAGCAYIPTENFGNTADFARATNPFAVSSTAGIAPTMNTMRDAGDLVTNWSLDTTPSNGGTPVIQLYTPGLMMISSTPEEQLATWLFMKYFTSADVQAQWATALSLIPVNNAALDLIDETAYFPGFYAMLQRVAAGDVNVYTSPQRLSYGTVRSILQTGIADITSGGMDVQEVAARMTEEANAALADEGQ